MSRIVVGEYIVANPVRAGLVENIGDYAHWFAVGRAMGGRDRGAAAARCRVFQQPAASLHAVDFVRQRIAK